MTEDVLKVQWSKKENDHMIHYPRRCDGALVQYTLFGTTMRFDLMKWNENKYSPPYEMTKSFLEELKERGYDLTTLKFSIKLKPEELGKINNNL